ncbi:Fibroblast growth factorreceptor 4 [Porites harrisoni]
MAATHVTFRVYLQVGVVWLYQGEKLRNKTLACTMFMPLQRAFLAALMALIPVKESFCTTCSVPEIRVKPHSNGSFYASEKTDVKFSCNIRRKGREVYQVHWEKDNKTLRAADHKRVTTVQRWLKIKNVKRGDAGLYSCIVLNKCGGRNVVHIRLYIRESAPTFTVSKRKLQQKIIALPVGNTVKLDCSAKGHPRPTIAWYRNGKPFNERRGRLLHLDRKYVLALKGVVPSDTGRYTCNVSNHLGWINHSYYVDVHERIRAKPVVLQMINATAFVGGSATLLCRAYSDAMPHFQWLRWFSMHSNSSGNSAEGSELHYDVIKRDQQASINWLRTSNGKHDFHEDTLTLDNVTKKSEGKYTCIVGNALGYSVRNAYIIVREMIVEILSEDGSTSTTSATIPSLNDSTEAGGQKRERPAEKKSWIDSLRYPWLLIGLLATVIITVITFPAWFCWKLKKTRASSPPAIASLRPRYHARNEYVVVPDFK